MANKVSMYKKILDILLMFVESPDFRHVMVAFGLKLDLQCMEKIIRTKYENTEILEQISKIMRFLI